MASKWRIEGGRGIWLVRGDSRAAAAAVGGEALTRESAAARVDAWFTGPWAGDGAGTLATIARALEGAFARSGGGGVEGLKRVLRRALVDGRLTAVRVPFEAPTWGDAEEQAEESLPVPRPPLREETTWIEVELTDEGSPPRPVAFARYRIELPDGSLRDGILDANGRARMVGLDPGTCKVWFPELDAEAWMRAGVAPARQQRGSVGVTRIIRQGDTTEALAAAAGLFWQTAWDHPANAALRARRRAPNILLAGDALFLPERLPRSEPCATTQAHSFRRRGIPSELRIRCLDEEQLAYAGVPYQLVGEGLDLRGTLDAAGWLRVPIPPGIQRLQLRLGEDGEIDEHELWMGHLDPLGEPTGLCDRLRNLGYYDGPSTVEMSDTLRGAMSWFRRDAGLDPAEDVDATFLDALRGVHHA
jgi:hypothetical protein